MIKTIRLLWILPFLLLTHGASGQSEAIFSFRITFQEASSTDLVKTVALGEAPKFSNLRFEQIGGADTLALPFQLSGEGGRELNWVVPAPVKAGESREYRLLTCGGPPAFSEACGMIQTDSTFILVAANRPVLSYQFRSHPAPAGVSPLYARSGFIHPLWSPSGRVLTWIQPPDHYHHYGLWNPWTKVTWKGRTTDFWNLGEGQGTVKYDGIVSKTSGPVFAEILVRHAHVAFDAAITAGQAPAQVRVMTELWRIRVWNVRGGFLIDFESELTPAIEEPLSLDVYRYGGGIGFRATPEWTGTNSEVITSEGKTWADGDATRARWCRISGTTDGAETGILFMSSSSNFDAPQPVRIWPKNLVGATSYHYFEFCPTREKAWILHPGERYLQKYRLWISEGSMTPEEMEQAWQSWNPPKH